MNLLKSFLIKDRLSLIKSKKFIYKNLSIEEIRDFQLNSFNQVWSNSYNNIPFYKYWKKKHSLPDTIQNLDELSFFPTLFKKDLQINKKLVFKNIENCETISTGGSSGEPTTFPTSKKESLNNYANIYMARSFFDIHPFERTLSIWGHSHLFGSGINGKFKQCKRQLLDIISNNNRLSAYDMSINNIEKFYIAIKNYNPKLIIGYTSVIYKLAKYIKENNLNLNLNLKGVLITSELVIPSDILLIEEVFNAPCINEYGMAETGAIAQSSSKPTELNVFWDSFIVSSCKSQNILVTTLNKRVFPLIKYNTDDISETKNNQSILKLNNIKGRSKDILKVKSNSRVLDLSGILFVHILKSFKGIMDIQFTQIDAYVVKINYTSTVQISNVELSNFFFKEIEKLYGKIDRESFVFERLNNIKKTVAGKIKLVNK